MKTLTILSFINFIIKENLDIPSMIFYFMIYSLLGWILENTYSLILTGVFFKEGFLKGPFKPMYGFAATLLIIYYNKYPNLLVIIPLSLIIPTIIEYCTGYLLKKYLNKQYWDYSKSKIQLNGYICLTFCIYWMFLSMFGITFLHPIIYTLHNLLSPIWNFVSILFITYISFDIFTTLKVFKTQKI